MKIQFQLNGTACRVDVPGARRLLDVLREDLGLTGTKEGCGEGECGACSILMDGEVVNACLIPAGQANGANLLTVEGLSSHGGESLQEAFVRYGAAQCGICTPGMLMAAHALAFRREQAGLPGASRQEIREALAGNLCRCTGYQKIIDAVSDALAGGLAGDDAQLAEGG